MSEIADTIAAVATAPGQGGIGIVRLSGPSALEIAQTLFQTKKSFRSAPETDAAPSAVLFQHRRLHFGYIIDPHRRQVIDEVLVAFMQAPNSYTREDVIEIQSHAGSAVLQTILGLVIDAGARLADAGEFTRRAFLNGRIDLTQAEAVADLISAKTEAALNMATRLLTGGMRHRIQEIQQQLEQAAGHLEAMIEFPEEMTDEAEALTPFRRTAGNALAGIHNLLKTYRESHIYRDGIQISVVGRPNVGKSSLLNALLEKERAIVTTLPGTTRDLVIDTFQVDGIPIQITDTAGMRASTDVIEQIGIQKTEESIASAHLVLLVVDAHEGYQPGDRDIYQQLAGKQVLLVTNKSDLNPGTMHPPEWVTADTPQVIVSAKHRHNIEALKRQVVALITQGDIGPPTDSIVPNLRQKNALEQAAAAVVDALQSSRNGESEEFIVFHLQSALNGLGTITGEAPPTDLLDLIFDRFCIGK
ncbi:MAG: tRNA uridine-5-carboxymethylaminomethyl(34) synthesis GTPase MnmE [Desulfosarcinaceae bacterium]|nr:tRNA uridine-5-carboxymethylaminomethyl(34) synthesis GTPase MnmE [Desulfosarcinaceae bacterium]